MEINNNEEQTTILCKICCTEYNEKSNKPYIINNCNHTVCFECLSKIVKTTRECPFCKSPAVNLSEMKPNYALIEVIEKLSKKTSFNCMQCKNQIYIPFIKKSNSKIKIICNECSEKDTESKNLETYLNKAKSDLKDLNTSFEQNMNFKTSKTLFINKTIFLIKERFEIFLLKIKKDLCDLLNNDAYKDYFETFKEKFQEEISSINKNCNMIDEKFKLFKLDNSIINSVNSLESIDKLSKILESFDEKANKLVNINEVDKFLEDFTTNSEYFRNNICLYNICQNFTEAFAITQLTNITSNTSTNDINTSNTNNTNTNSNYTSYNNTYQYRNENNNGNTFFTNGSNYSNGNINNSYSGYSNYNNNRNGSNGNINQTSIFKAVKAFIPKDKRKPVEYYEHFVPIIGFKRSIHKDKEKLIVILKQRFKEFKVKTISIIEKDDELYGTQVVFEKGEDIAEFMKNKSFNLAMDNSDVYLNQKSNKDGNRFYVTYKK